MSDDDKPRVLGMHYFDCPNWYEGSFETDYPADCEDCNNNPREKG